MHTLDQDEHKELERENSRRNIGALPNRENTENEEKYILEARPN